MTKVGIILGSTRPGRVCGAVGRWAHDIAVKHGGAEYELVDLKDFDLPHLDEPVPALMSQEYSHPHTGRWAATVASFDAYLFVTPEYNRTFPGSLKAAIDFLYPEWNNKSAGFVSYGMDGGVRAVEHLRNTMAALAIADVRRQVVLSMHHDFVDLTEFKPRAHQAEAVADMLDEVIAWAVALRPLREG